MTTPARLRALLFVPGWGGTRVRPAIPSASQKVFPARCARPARSARMCIEAPRLRPVGADGCGAGLVEGIASRVAVWLDTEYPEDSLREPHAAAGAAAARHYAAIRAGGEDDVGSVLLALGGALEADGVLFRDLFVGPWEVANKVTDMVIAGARAFGTAVPPPAWQADDSGDQDQDALAFERFNFLSKVLDGGAAKEVRACAPRARRMRVDADG